MTSDKLKEGTKLDDDKPEMSLIDAQALEGLARVLTFGAKKYEAHNWRKGIAYSRIVNSLMRHLMAIQKGELIDPESGLPHIDHLGCNWMFLSNYMKTKPELNDLASAVPVKKNKVFRVKLRNKSVGGSYWTTERAKNALEALRSCGERTDHLHEAVDVKEASEYFITYETANALILHKHIYAYDLEDAKSEAYKLMAESGEVLLEVYKEEDFAQTAKEVSLMSHDSFLDKDYREAKVREAEQQKKPNYFRTRFYNDN